MNDGGYEELMYILMNRDISGRNFEKIPITEAKRGTVLNNLDEFSLWIIDLVMGKGIRIGLESAPDDTTFYEFNGTEIVAAEALYESYTKSLPKSARRATSAMFGKWINKRLPSLAKGRFRVSKGMTYTLPRLEEIIADIKKNIGYDVEPDMGEEKIPRNRVELFEIARKERAIEKAEQRHF